MCLLHCVMFLLDVYTEYGKKEIERMFNRKAKLTGEVTMKVNGHIVHTCTHMYLCTYIRTYIHIYAHIHPYVLTYVHVHTYVHRYIYTYIYTCMCLFSTFIGSQYCWSVWGTLLSFCIGIHKNRLLPWHLLDED